MTLSASAASGSASTLSGSALSGSALSSASSAAPADARVVRPAAVRGLVRVVLRPRGTSLAGALDDDPAGLDGDRHRAVSGPVLGVDRVVLDARVEPQAVALLAVVERALEHARARAPTAPPTAPTAAPTASAAGAAVGPLAGILGVLGVVGVLVTGCDRLLFGLRLDLGGDQGVVLGPEVGLLFDDVRGQHLFGALRRLAGHQPVLALELADVTHRHVELVGDPRVRAPLANPAADLVELRLQRPARHQRARLATGAGA